MNHESLETEIRNILTRITETDVSSVGLDEQLADTVGLDSLGRLELLSELEEKLDVTIYELDSEKTSTIRGMLEIVEKAQMEMV